MTTEDIEARKRAAREKLAALEHKDDEAEELRQLALDELTVKLAEEHGRPGKDFVILDTAIGPIALKPAQAILWTRYVSRIPDNGQPKHEDAFAFVSPCVIHPSREEFAKLADARAGIVQAAANELAHLYQGKDRTRRPK